MKRTHTLRSFLSLAAGSTHHTPCASGPRMLAAIPAAAMLLASGASAQTTYSFTDASGGTQAWTDGTNWSGGVAPDPVAGDTIQVNLSMSAATFLDLGADRTFGVWTTNLQGFGSKDFTINSGHTITLAGTTPTITVNGGSGTILRMENILAGSAGLRKNGSHTLILNNASNSFSGGIDLAAGALQVASDGALGDAGNDITVSGNSTLNLANNMTMARDVLLNTGTTLTFSASVTSTISGAITGAGGIDMNPSGFGSQSLTLSSTGNTFTGAIKVGGDATPTLTVNSLADSANSLDLRVSNKGDTRFIWGSGADSALVLNERQVILSGNNTRNHVIENANADANHTITINKDLSITSTSNRKLVLGGINEGANTIGGVIPNGVGGLTSLEKTGNGTWIVSGDNTYTGTTGVISGTLIVNGDQSLATGNVSVDSGATLGGSGILGGAATISGSLAPGNSIGALTVNNNVTWNAGNAWEFELGTGNTSDRLAITGTGNDFLKGTGNGWTFDFLGSTALGTFTLVTWADTTTFAATDFSALNYNGAVPGSFSISGNSLLFTAIPEPSTALAGILLGLGLLRRRRTA